MKKGFLYNTSDKNIINKLKKRLKRFMALEMHKTRKTQLKSLNLPIVNEFSANARFNLPLRITNNSVNFIASGQEKKIPLCFNFHNKGSL